MIAKFLQAIGKGAPPLVVRFFFNMYPPYLGAGIKVEEISPDRKYLRVALKLRFYNRNYVGTQFGGSIYSMTDPHFMFLLMNNLGTDYVVWDKGAKIDFLKPGKSNLTAEFRIDDEILTSVREKTSNGEKYIFDLLAVVRDAKGEVMADVSKTLYVRRKYEKLNVKD